MKVLIALSALLSLALAFDPYRGWDPEICCYPVPEGCCPEVCPKCLDVAWILDESASITPDQFSMIQDFLTDFKDNFIIGPDDFLTAAVQFATGARLTWNLGDNLDDMAESDAISMLTRNGGFTNVMAGIDLTISDVIGSAGDREDCDNVCIIVTDGLAQGDADDIKAKADELRAACGSTLVVGIEQNVLADNTDLFKQQLEDLAGSPDNVFDVENFSDLADVVGDLATKICDDNGSDSTGDCCPYDFIFFLGGGYGYY